MASSWYKGRAAPTVALQEVAACCIQFMMPELTSSLASPWGLKGCVQASTQLVSRVNLDCARCMQISHRSFHTRAQCYLGWKKDSTGEDESLLGGRTLLDPKNKYCHDTSHHCWPACWWKCMAVITCSAQQQLCKSLDRAWHMKQEHSQACSHFIVLDKLSEEGR